VPMTTSILPPNNTPRTGTVPEITAGEFLGIVERGERVQLLDVRAPARVADGRIDILPEGMFRNIPGSRLLSCADLGETGIDPGAPVVVVCGHGNDSRLCAAYLNRLGARARSLTGGMASWMALAVPREIVPPPGLDRLVQVDRVGKGSLGYVLLRENEALILDPGREHAPFRDVLRDAAAKPVAVADTHVHADYISGGPSLARALGVPYFLHPGDSVSPYDGRGGRLDFRPLEEGMTMRLGTTVVTVAHTPGHSPGSVTFMVGEAAAFTGDFLFVGSVGRPDIADRADEWAGDLWRSLLRVKTTWSPAIRIFPAHYGSGGERTVDGAVCGTLRDMLVTNPPLRFDGETAFRSWVRANSRTVPPSYRVIKEINLALVSVPPGEADRLEAGRNECALGAALPPSSHF